MSQPKVIDQSLPCPTRSVTVGSVATFIAMLGVTLGAGLLFRLGALKPANILPLGVANFAFNLHSSSGLLMPMALLVGFAARITPRGRGGMRTLLATSVLAIGLATSVFINVMGVEASPLFLGQIAFIHAFVGIYAVYAALFLAERPALGIAVAGIAYFLAGVGLIAGVMPASGWALKTLIASSFAIISQEESGKLRLSSLIASIAFALPTLAVSFSDSPVIGFFAFWGNLAIAYFLVATTRAALRTDKPQCWSRRYYNLAMIVFVQSVLLRALLDALTIKTIHDTLFPVGAMHLEYFTPALALLGLAYRDWERKDSGLERKRLAWVGFGLLAIGAHVMAWGFVALGRGGMPRRMCRYLDQFQHLQIVCTMGAIALVIGIILAISALLPIARGRATRALP